MRYALAAKNAQISPSRRWEEIHGFVESNGRMKRIIKALTGGLTEVVSGSYVDDDDDDKEDFETIQVVHQSVNDFLRAKGLALLYSISASTASIDRDTILFHCQATLYRSCLLYLATITKEISGLQGPLEAINLVQNHPFLSYTTIRLFVHAEKAAGADSLQNEKEILEQIIDGWVSIYLCLNQNSTACPPRGTNVLHMAATANMVDVIKSVLSGGENIERKDEIGNTALYSAAKAGHIIAGKLLQERGANLEAENGCGATPLMEAARCGRLMFVEWILDEGVELETNLGGGVLQAASLTGHHAIMEILLGVGADINAKGGKYGTAPAAASDNETIRQYCFC